MNTFTLETEFGTYKNCYFILDNYRYDDSIYLGVESEEEGPICDLTVCVEHDDKFTKNETVIDTNNCPFAPKFLETNNFGRPTGKMEFSGYCVYPVFKLNMDKIKEYSLEGK